MLYRLGKEYTIQKLGPAKYQGRCRICGKSWLTYGSLAVAKLDARTHGYSHDEEEVEDGEGSDV